MLEEITEINLNCNQIGDEGAAKIADALKIIILSLMLIFVRAI